MGGMPSRGRQRSGEQGKLPAAAGRHVRSDWQHAYPLRVKACHPVQIPGSYCSFNPMSDIPTSVTMSAKPGLKRVLGLWALVIYGIILVQPTAAMPLYGNVAEKARGHVVTTILIGMVAMLFTAISYGRMANAYPTAGSAYSYVGQELHSSLGYLTGWAMVFDYVLNPIISVVWCSKAAMNFLPEVPYPLWAVVFALLFTGLNLRGIKASARTNQWMAGGLTVVVAIFLGAAVR